MRTKDNLKKIFVVALIFLLVLISSYAFAARQKEAQAPEKPSIAMQFVQSFTCIVTQCGWPAIVLLILPAIAVYIWKKVFSWG